MNKFFRNALQLGVKAATSNGILSVRPMIHCIQQKQRTFVKLYPQSTCPNFVITAKRYLENDDQRERRKEYALTYDEFKSAVEKDEVYLIDVREQSEVDEGKVPAKRYANISVKIIEPALKLSSEEFQNKFGVSKPDLNERLVFMCRSGVRSTFALRAAQANGFKNSKHFLGGWLEWSEKFLGIK